MSFGGSPAQKSGANMSPSVARTAAALSYMMLTLAVLARDASGDASGNGGGVLVGQFYPATIDNLFVGESVPVAFVPFSTANGTADGPIRVQAHVDDASVASVDEPSEWTVTFVNGTQSLMVDDVSNISFVLRGQFLGRTNLLILIVDSSSNNSGYADDSAVEREGPMLPITVTRRRSALDRIFIFSVVGLVCLAYVNMGCKLDFGIIKSVVRRPAAIGVGIVAQYTFMPLVAFGLSYLFVGNPSLRLSLFVTGCCPGGGASNMWALLLGGNINLSVTLTFFSTLLAFVALPAWIFTLGRVLFEVAGLRIPYENVGTLVLGLVVPVGLGLLIKRFLPRVAEVLSKTIRPLFILIILYIVTFGIYTNLYVFRLLTFQIILASIALIWGGFLFGGFAGLLFGFPVEDCITLALETGIQNSGVAIVLLRLSLPQPEGDISLVFPIMADVVMAIPPTIAVILVNFVCKSWKLGNKEGSDRWPLPRASESDSDPNDGTHIIPSSGVDTMTEPILRRSANQGYNALTSSP